MALIAKFLFKWQLFRANEWTRASVYHRHLGVSFGERVRITGHLHFATEPYLVTIGSDVTLTQDITFHTHDGGVGLFRSEFPGMNVFGKIEIGNHVFVGSNVIILPGVSIGSNVVIGAGSVVTRDVPNDVVVAGSPAKVIRTIAEYREKSLSKAIFITAKDAAERRKEIETYLSKKL